MNTFDFLENKKLKSQLDFLVEIDKMKNIFRRTVIIDKSRRENDAEHSWHFAMLAMILEEYSSNKVDVTKAIKIALVHDLVEVYAGDTFAYDEKAKQDKRQRELEAADKIFGMLPPEQCAYIRALWDEFEAKETPEAKYANVCDRLQPLMHNYLTDGHTWKEGDVHAPQVLGRMDIIRETAPELWKAVEGMVKISVEQGILKP
ncbi:MAG: HD domain-containing protein [Clostridia bacterium]|nr:HD domain-containing protein [Clostridia bacterium]